MVSTELKWKDSPVKWIPLLHRCVYICVCARARMCVCSVCVCVVCMCVYELKMRREEGIQLASIELRCEKPGCMFGGQTKAGLVNHTRPDKTWQHGTGPAQVHILWHSFHKQGITMHMRHCSMNPSGH